MLDVLDKLITQLRDGVLVGLSDTASHGGRPGERKARLLLEVLRDREPDVLRRFGVITVVAVALSSLTRWLPAAGW